MTASRSGGGGSRTALFVVLMILVLVVIGVLSNNSKSSAAFDPKSTAKAGTKAFVETVEHFGTTVTVPDHFPADDVDIAVLFVNAVPDDRLDDVRAWVRAGHTLVVTTPESELTLAGAAGAGPHISSQAVVLRDTCTLDALGGLASIDRGTVGSLFNEFEVPPGAASCFGDGSTAFVVSQAEGAGRIVSIAGGGLFQNQNLGKPDNAGLATAIFAPHPGVRVAVITDAAFAAGENSGGADTSMSLQKIITFGTKLAVLQLAVAIIVYGLSRGRRLGRPVLEPQPVQIAGSELVSAVGNLLLQRKQPGTASVLLRSDLRRQICGRIGLAFDASPDLIAATVAAQTALDHDVVLRAVADYPVTTDAELVELANQIDAIRKEVLHEHAT